jgi:phosphoadenylyl-sulfate reductase (thioredoxin)
MARTATAVEFDPLEDLGASEVLAWALETYSPDIALSVAGGTEGLVVLDLATRIRPDVRVFTLDTGRLHRETLRFFDQVEDRYGITIHRYHPDPGQLERMAAAFGADLQYRGVNFRALCCQIRKVVPMRHALAGLDAYVTGIRREQTASRADAAKAEFDEEHGVVKVNPIADWTKQQVADYAAEHEVPTHPLLASGVGANRCAPSPPPPHPGEDERAGRWWWESGDVSKECGLHSRPAGALDFELEEIVGEEDA